MKTKCPVFLLIQLTLIYFFTSCTTTGTFFYPGLKDVYDTTSRRIMPAVKIGDQIWLSKNLDVDHYRNGDPIPQVQDPKVWNKLKTGAWCYDISICKYGFQVSKLYNWYAVNDPRGLAPEGWHIPTDVECTTLISYLGGKNIALNKLIETGKIHWAGTNKNVTNESGFTAIPFGRTSSVRKFVYPNTLAAYWTESPYSKSSAYSLNIEQYDDYIGIRKKYNKEIGLSVRCILD